MSEHDDGTIRPPKANVRPGMKLVKLHCRRVDAQVTPDDHASCPYCFGKLADVETGHHERFCDYKPGKDPIHFGFPEGSSHDQAK